MIPHSLKTFVKKSPHVFQNSRKSNLVTSRFPTMGQALSSCAACCSGNAQGCKDETYQKAGESYQKAVCESYQKAVPKIHNHQSMDCGFEKITTNDDKIVLAVDPKFPEEEIAGESYQKAVCESYQKAVPKIHNHQSMDCGFEKITTNDDKIVLAVDPKFPEEEIAADRKKILMNLKSKSADRTKILEDLLLLNFSTKNS